MQLVGRAPAGSNLSEPSVSDHTDDQGSLFAWSQYGAEGDLVLKRVTKGETKRISLPLGVLNTFAEPDIEFRPPGQGDSWLLASNASGDDLAGTLGTYVWSSSDSKTWTRHKVWDSFGLPDMAPDGHGGLWLITGQTGVQVVHVPATWETQSYVDHDQIDLSDRIASRLDMGIATAGKQDTLLTAFDSATGVWVHVGSEPGLEHDVRIFKKGALFEGIGGNSLGALVVGRHVANYAQSGDLRLYGRYLTFGSAGAHLSPEFPISKLDVVDASVTTSSGGHTVTWITDTQRLYTAKSSVKQHVRDTKLAIQFPHGQWNNPLWPRYLGGMGSFAFAYDAKGRQSFVRITHQ